MTYSTMTLTQTHGRKASVLDIPTIKFDKHARKQLRAIYAHVGGRLLCSIRLRIELGEYIRYREAGSEPLDTLGQTLRFDEHLAVCLMKVHGQWIVTDVWELAPVASILPVVIWRKMKRGVDFILRQVLVGWRYLTKDGLANGGTDEARH